MELVGDTLLISTQYNFLFVHIPKTAGVSVKTKFRVYANCPPRSQFRRALAKLPLRENELRMTPPTHATADWARRKLGDKRYFALTSFAVVRHPYDRAISYYQFIRQYGGHHRHELVKEMSFEDYLDDLARRPRRKRQTQTDFLVDGRGAVIVDRILRFESLASEIEALWAELGLPGDAKIPHRNASARRASEEYLTPRARDLIFELYRDDFARLGYER